MSSRRELSRKCCITELFQHYVILLVLYIFIFCGKKMNLCFVSHLASSYFRILQNVKLCALKIILFRILIA